MYEDNHIVKHIRANLNTLLGVDPEQALDLIASTVVAEFGPGDIRLRTLFMYDPMAVNLMGGSGTEPTFLVTLVPGRDNGGIELTIRDSKTGNVLNQFVLEVKGDD